MKKLSLAVLLVAATAFAGTYTITTNQGQDNRLEKDRVRRNKESCKAAQRPEGCTQNQCRQTNPDCNIYSDVQDLLARGVVKPYTDALKQKDTQDDQAEFCAWWNAPATTVGQRNSVCATSGLSNGCELCQ